MKVSSAGTAYPDRSAFLRFWDRDIVRDYCCGQFGEAENPDVTPAAGAKWISARDAPTRKRQQLAAAYSEKVSRVIGGNERFEFGRHKVPSALGISHACAVMNCCPLRSRAAAYADVAAHDEHAGGNGNSECDEKEIQDSA